MFCLLKSNATLRLTQAFDSSIPSMKAPIWLDWLNSSWSSGFKRVVALGSLLDNLLVIVVWQLKSCHYMIWWQVWNFLWQQSLSLKSITLVVRLKISYLKCLQKWEDMFTQWTSTVEQVGENVKNWHRVLDLEYKTLLSSFTIKFR